MKTVYIAHPLSQGDSEAREANFTTYLKVCAAATRDCDVAVVSFAAHYEMHRRGLLVLPAEEWLRRDFALIYAAEEAWFVGHPDSADSVGMVAEWRIAGAYGRPRRIVALRDDGGLVVSGALQAARAEAIHSVTEAAVLAWAQDAYAKRARGESWR